MFGRKAEPGGQKERSRYAVQGDERLPKGFLIGLDVFADTTELAHLASLARRLLRDKAAFEHRQMRRREGVFSVCQEVSR